MDEATAAIDHRADSRIQGAVKESFANRTVLIISHRAETLADYTRRLRVDNGTIKDDDNDKRRSSHASVAATRSDAEAAVKSSTAQVGEATAAANVAAADTAATVAAAPGDQSQDDAKLINE